MNQPFISIAEAIDEIKNGKMIILVDDEERENEGDLIIAAEHVTPEIINFMSKYGRGLICMPMVESQINRLQIPMMVKENDSKYNTPFTISIGAAQGIGTGISAFDRAHTVQVAVDPKSTRKDIRTPGHIFPLKARQGGVLERAGHTEGSSDLAKLAGLSGATVICEVLAESGHSAHLPELIEFAKEHHIKIAAINDLIAYRMAHETLVKEISSSQLPLNPHGEFQIKIFENLLDGSEHIALVKGSIDEDKPALVRVHSECVTGDAFGSARCDCGWQLQASLKQIGEQGGVLLYLRQEGRGIGLANKIKAYALQDNGLDTVEANQHLGFQPDHRDYGIGSQLLRALGVKKMKLLTNNPRKMYGIKGYGLEVVERVAIESIPTDHNSHYLRTKREKLGHLLTLED